VGAGADVRDLVERRWQDFRAAVDAADLDGTSSAGWTRKEMVAHVAFWLETVAPFVTGMWRGDPSAFEHRFPSGYQPEGEWPAADVHNAREAAWARGHTAEAVVARLDAAASRVRDLLGTVTDAEVTDHAEYFAEISDHLDQHLGELDT
jgi:hypothetical protein